ncbi:SDR family NAD(P)-dependent oxidoreductase [Corticicoccus populi]|uniref:SDR family NAD(P)-dependent oxidoreductase n=1 Tax=Corticicoccus populi TaxID=1812821 RepID=A0ABW5WT04_9STAP
MGRLDQKVTIITGAANGMGAVTAELFAREGAKVIATDLDKDKLDEVVAGINNEYDSAAIAVRHDVSKAEDWKNVVDEGLEAFGTINGLVNNAGVQGKDLVLDDSEVEDWDLVMDIDAKGVFLGIKAVLPALKKAGSGSIVNIGSMGALLSTKNSSVTYGAAKGAITAFSKSSALHLGKDNIRINVIQPGAIRTPLMNRMLDAEQIKEIEKYTLLGKVGESEDVAYTSLFLISDEAAFINGTEILVDGGWSINGDKS